MKLKLAKMALNFTFNIKVNPNMGKILEKCSVLCASSNLTETHTGIYICSYGISERSNTTVNTAHLFLHVRNDGK